MRNFYDFLRLGRIADSSVSPETRKLELTASAKSVQGPCCDMNEDSFLMDSRRGIFVLADGIGGRCGGQHASQIAAEGLMREAQAMVDNKTPGECLINGMAKVFTHVNDSLLGIAGERLRMRGMGASALMAVVDNGWLYVVGAGDCRAYLIRDRKPVRLTVDQTLYQMLVEAGLALDERQAANGRRVLWSYLGDPKIALPPIRREEVLGSDRLILITNGVSRVVSDELLGRLSAESRNAVEAAENIVDTAQMLNTPDDATCLAVSFKSVVGGPLHY